MGKANRVKARDKKTKWEDLVKLRNDITMSLLNQISLMQELFNNNQSTILKDPEVSKILQGIFLSYNDISKEIRFNSEKHITYKFMVSKDHDIEYYNAIDHRDEYENMVNNNIEDFNTELSHRTGILNEKNHDELMLYYNIISNYASIEERIANMASYSYMEVMRRIGASESTQKELNEFANITDEILIAGGLKERKE